MLGKAFPAAVAVLVGLSSGAVADERKSYRATYSLALVGAPAHMKLDGQAWTVRQRRCNKWAEEGSVSFSIQSKGKPTISVLQDFEGEEAINGTSLHWLTKMVTNGQRSEIRSAGIAAAAGGNGTIEVLHDGAAQTIDLPQGAYFPIAGMQEIVIQLAAGKTTMRMGMFYPGAARRVLEQTVVVVEPPAGPAPPADPAGLLSGPNWPIKITKVIDGRPNEAIMQVHRNGVVSRMLMMTMGGNRISFALQSIEPLPDTGCVSGQLSVR